jgi:hypothetical protein
MMRAIISLPTTPAMLGSLVGQSAHAVFFDRPAVFDTTLATFIASVAASYGARP